jgi:hypothetical protein
VALTDDQVREVQARLLVKDPTLGQSFKKAEIETAIRAADAWAERTMTDREAAMPTTWRATASNVQTGRLFAYVAAFRGGVI